MEYIGMKEKDTSVEALKEQIKHSVNQHFLSFNCIPALFPAVSLYYSRILTLAQWGRRDYYPSLTEITKADAVFLHFFVVVVKNKMRLKTIV